MTITTLFTWDFLREAWRLLLAVLLTATAIATVAQVDRGGSTGTAAAVLTVALQGGGWLLMFVHYNRREGVEREAWRSAAVGTLAVTWVGTLITALGLQLLDVKGDAPLALSLVTAGMVVVFTVLLNFTPKRSR